MTVEVQPELTRLFTMPPEFKPVDVIETVPQLVAHLKVAAQVEMSTIPPYLYAAYSIRTKGYSQWSPGIGAARTLTAIAVEEMLHLCLVRNLLVAIGHGDDITFCSPKFVPVYPGQLPHHQGKLVVHLEHLSTAVTRDTFMVIEQPEVRPEPLLEAAAEQVGEYATLGEFYRRIRAGFELLVKEKKIDFANCGAEYQYRRAYWNQNGGGKTIVVTDLKTALLAIDTIIDQGEGADPAKGTVPRNPVSPRAGLEEYSHYERFERIAKGIEGIGIVDGTREATCNIDSPEAVARLVRDPHVDDDRFRDNKPLLALMRFFNGAFTYTLALLDELYHTPETDIDAEKHSHRYRLERVFIAAMQGLLYPIADVLTRTETGPTVTVNGEKYPETAGPPFEFHRFKPGDLTGQLAELCDQAMAYFPEFGGSDGVRNQIRLLPELVAR